MRSWPMIVALAVVLAGCSGLDANKSKVQKAISAWQNSVNRSDWGSVEKMLANDFSLTANKVRLPGQGKEGFVGMFQHIKDRRGFSVDSTTLSQVSPTEYRADLETQMKTAGDPLGWRMQQTWKKNGAAWQIAAVTVMPPGPGSALKQVGKEIGQAADYAIGYTQLKKKKQATDTINKLNDEHNRKLEEALGE